MANKETSEILYSLWESPGWIEYKEKKVNGVKLNPKSKRTHPFDLLNWAVIKLDGSIQQGSQEFYDTRFKKELNTFRSNEKAKLFLDYHFEKIYDKRKLLNHIEIHIIRDFRTSPMDVLLTPEKIDLVAEWIREKKKELPKVKPEKESKPKKLRDCFHTDEDFNNAITAFKNSIPLNKDGMLTIATKGLAVRAAWHVFNSKMNLKCQTMSVFIKLLAKEFGYALKDGKNTGGKTPKSEQYQTYLSAIESAYTKINGEVKKK